MEQNDDNELQTSLAVLKTEMSHISDAILDIKEMVSGMVRPSDFQQLSQKVDQNTKSITDLVRPQEFEHLREKVEQNQDSINRFKTLQVYIAAIAAIVSPIVLLILSKLLGGILGS